MKKIISILVIIVLLFGFYKILSIPPKSSSDTSTKAISTTIFPNPDFIFYWGEGCPHCKNVEDFINTNQINQKLKINYKEIYKNSDNQKELTQSVQKYCPDLIQKEGIGIPVLFDPTNQKCFQGDKSIIDFLNQKLNG